MRRRAGVATLQFLLQTLTDLRPPLRRDERTVRECEEPVDVAASCVCVVLEHDSTDLIDGELRRLPDWYRASLVVLKVPITEHTCDPCAPRAHAGVVGEGPSGPSWSRH